MKDNQQFLSGSPLMFNFFYSGEDIDFGENSTSMLAQLN